MPKAEEKLAGDYELLADRFTRPESAEEGKQGSYARPKLNDPDATVLVTYERGELVALSNDEAKRLLEGPRPAVGKPGAAEEAAAAVLEGQIALLKARQEQVQAEAEARKAEASGEPDEFRSPPRGFEAQTADVVPLDPYASPLVAGAEESKAPGDKDKDESRKDSAKAGRAAPKG